MSDTPTPDYGEPWKFSRGEPSIESRDDDAVLTGIDYEIDDAKIQRAVSCVNACAGMADPAAEITAMREAIREAIEHLCNVGSGRGCLLGFDLDDAMPEIEAALAKLQPFTTP
jgi:hypothetical protein